MLDLGWNLSAAADKKGRLALAKGSKGEHALRETKEEKRGRGGAFGVPLKRPLQLQQQLLLHKKSETRLSQTQEAGQRKAAEATLGSNAIVCP